MATAAKETPQDLPPKGGYAPFNISRVPLRPLFRGRTVIGIFLAGTALSVYLRYLSQKKRKREQIEMRSARFALLPLLLAEKDRVILKNMRRVYQTEAEIMEKFENWKVGTYHGEPIFKTLPEDTWVDPEMSESHVFSHASGIDEDNFLRKFL